MQRFDIFNTTMSISSTHDNRQENNNSNNKKQKIAKRMHSDRINLDEVYMI